ELAVRGDAQTHLDRAMGKFQGVDVEPARADALEDHRFELSKRSERVGKIWQLLTDHLGYSRTHLVVIGRAARDRRDMVTQLGFAARRRHLVLERLRSRGELTARRLPDPLPPRRRRAAGA